VSPARDRMDLLPLRQLVTGNGDAASAFARQSLLDGLSRPDRFRIVRHGEGAQILAAGEHALSEAQVVLRQAYGALVTFGEPSVHTWVDPREETLMVPVMFMRADVPRPQLPALLEVLQERAATARDVEVQRSRAVIRAEVPLVRGLGLERQILEITDGSAHVLSWLLRYERATAAPA
jgi:hypothetical protein